MQENKLVPIEASAILLVLCVCGILLNLYQLTIYSNNIVIIAMVIAACASYISATIYCLKGYNKQNAKYFKYMCIAYVAYAVLYLLSLISTFENNSRNILLLILAVLILVSRIVLAFKKDLGEKLSIVFVAILLICSIITMVIYLRTYLLIGLDCVGRVGLDCILAIMVYGKYRDKKFRKQN